MGMARVAIVGLLVLVACSPGEGLESIALPTSPDSTTTTTTTTTLVPPLHQAEIRRTTDGVPHITGDTSDDVAYGQGWVSGEDHGCTLIDQILKVTSTRSAALGPAPRARTSTAISPGRRSASPTSAASD